MDMLSRELRLSDMVRSARATLNKIKNTPTPEHRENLVAWAEHVYQPLCDHFKELLYVSSGYRSAALNAITPGASATSQHSTGEAGDLDQDGQDHGITNQQVFQYIRDHLSFDQLIWEHGDDKNPAWVHVSFTTHRTNRGQVLRARFKKGTKKVEYTPFTDTPTSDAEE